jgi:L-lactate dehydrogenase complex protein LldE
MIVEDVVMPSVVLFPTCLGDVVARRTVSDAQMVLEALGFDVRHPRGATCCGQPAYNSGWEAPARKVALATLRALDDGGDAPIIIASGSCTSMIRLHWREVFHGTPEAESAVRVARRVRELSAFLADHIDRLVGLDLRYAGRVGYHDSCHMLRELRIHDAPRAVLGAVEGLELVPLASSDRCCGFGGTFSGRYPDVSVAMADTKLDDAETEGVDLLVSADPGCLMQLGGRSSRRGSPVRMVHVASLLREAMPR